MAYQIGQEVQATKLVEINFGISRLDKATKNNTAMVEKTKLVGRRDDIRERSLNPAEVLSAAFP